MNRNIPRILLPTVVLLSFAGAWPLAAQDAPALGPTALLGVAIIESGVHELDADGPLVKVRAYPTGVSIFRIGVELAYSRGETFSPFNCQHFADHCWGRSERTWRWTAGGLLQANLPAGGDVVIHLIPASAGLSYRMAGATETRGPDTFCFDGAGLITSCPSVPIEDFSEEGKAVGAEIGTGVGFTVPVGGLVLGMEWRATYLFDRIGSSGSLSLGFLLGW